MKRPSLLDKLKETDRPLAPRRREPLWTGPGGAGPNGGCTQGLLNRFLQCRERFRLYAIEGLRPHDTFNHRLEFGNLWHCCEEALAKGNDPTRGGRQDRAEPLWQAALLECAKEMCRRYQMAQEQVDHWYNVCKVTFPLYVDYWAKHPDVTTRTPLLQEQAFDVPYPLPSGRRVRLRGKWDSVDLVRDSKGRTSVWLQENKTKGDINEIALRRQLGSGFELQTMLYLTALYVSGDLGKRGEGQFPNDGPPYRMVPLGTWVGAPIAGVRYNVIRRPLSGGKGTIVRGKGTVGSKCPKCKGTGKFPMSACLRCGGNGRVGGKPPETKEAYYARLAEYIKAEPATYFMRWNVGITPVDITRFRRECLDPILEQMYDWFEWVSGHPDPFELNESVFTDGGTALHFRYPYECFNPLSDGGMGDIDAFLENGNEIGLTRTATLFPELQ